MHEVIQILTLYIRSKTYLSKNTTYSYGMPMIMNQA